MCSCGYGLCGCCCSGAGQAPEDSIVMPRIRKVPAFRGFVDVITVTKSDLVSELGLTVQPSEWGTLLVTGIEPGLVDMYNALAIGMGGMYISDEIIRINQSMDVEGMLEALTAPDVVEFSIDTRNRFLCKLSRSVDEAWGMALGVGEGTLLVKGLKDGDNPVTRFNEATGGPQLAQQQRILSVNGTRTDTKKMVYEIRTALELTLVIMESSQFQKFPIPPSESNEGEKLVAK
mmetsp:Transcript_76871/g.235291  ORF Transcript_76871/g.235291 Transcript_76871/m.235291 type:complete len:232 (-) Transcript_76871:159-854(-)